MRTTRSGLGLLGLVGLGMSVVLGMPSRGMGVPFLTFDNVDDIRGYYGWWNDPVQGHGDISFVASPAVLNNAAALHQVGPSNSARMYHYMQDPSGPNSFTDMGKYQSFSLHVARSDWAGPTSGRVFITLQAKTVGGGYDYVAKALCNVSDLPNDGTFQTITFGPGDFPGYDLSAGVALLYFSVDGFDTPDDNGVYASGYIYFDEMTATFTQTVHGTVALNDFSASGDPRDVGVRVEFRQGGTAVKTAWAMLDTNRQFTIDNVTVATYDEVAVKAYAHLQAVRTNVQVAEGSTDLGTYTLLGGDNDDDNKVTSTDLSIVLAKMDAMGDE